MAVLMNEVGEDEKLVVEEVEVTDSEEEEEEEDEVEENEENDDDDEDEEEVQSSPLHSKLHCSPTIPDPAPNSSSIFISGMNRIAILTFRLNLGGTRGGAER